jgi:O-antigen/teichoic acid export membrane protein
VTQAPASDDVRFVAREGGVAGVLGLVGAACRYGNMAVLTRVLGKEAYGLFALAGTVISLLAMAANLGLPVSTVQFVASAAGTERWARVRWVLGAALRLVVVSSIAWAAIVLIAAPAGARAIFDKPQLALPLMGLAVALPLLGIHAVVASGLQGLKEIRAKVILERIAHPVVFSVFLLGGFYFRSIGYVLAAFVITSLVVALLGAAWLARRVRKLPASPPAADEDDAGGGPLPAGTVSELLRFSTPVLFLNLLNYLIFWSDVLVMGMFRASAEVGIYQVASRLGVAVNMPTEALNSSLAPSYAAAHGRGDRAGLTRTFHTSTRWIFTLSALAFLGIAFGGPAILRVFGSDFVAGHAVVGLLAAGQLFSAACGTNGMLLTMTGRPHVNLANALLLGGLNLGLNLVLVPRYGGIGAAASAATSWALVNIARCVEIWFIFRLVPWDRTFLKPLFAFALACGAGGGALALLGPALGLIPKAVVAAAAAGLVFPGVLWAAGLEPEDRDLLARFRARLTPAARP